MENPLDMDLADLPNAQKNPGNPKLDPDKPANSLGNAETRTKRCKQAGRAESEIRGKGETPGAQR